MWKKKRYADLRVLFWLIACVLLFVFYFLTFPPPEHVKQFSEYSAEERIIIVQKEEQILQDGQNMQAAKNTGIRAYCSMINDTKLYHECINVTVDTPVIEQQVSNQELSDKANLQAATNTNDAAYCELIQDVSIKSSCTALFGNGG